MVVGVGGHSVSVLPLPPPLTTCYIAVTYVAGTEYVVYFMRKKQIVIFCELTAEPQIML